MTHVPCGYAVIINNILFDEDTKLEVREGSDIDVKKMEKLFHWLQFKVEKHENKTAAEIVSIVRKYQVEIDHSKYDCFVLFLMSHGFAHGIYGTDGEKVFIQRDIREHLTADKCYSLAKKPKLIFVQACRGGNPDKPVVVTDSPSPQAGTMPSQEISSQQSYIPANLDHSSDFISPEFQHPEVTCVPQDSDIMIAYAATANHAALRNVTTGGWFVSQLYDVMDKYAATEDLQSMMTKVTGKVATRRSARDYMQCPELNGNLRRKVYFKPSKSWKLN
jgi:hypothetical protein